MQKNRKFYYEGGEEALTHELTKPFRTLGFRAGEVMNNGHCDILIELDNKDWQWLGEAKKHKDYAYLHKGMNQLLKRYSDGDENHDHGGMVIYISNVKGKDVIDDWKHYLQHELPCFQQMTPSKKRRDYSFNSEHAHDSGRTFHVKHIGIWLHHKPDDEINIKPKAERIEKQKAPVAVSRVS